MGSLAAVARPARFADLGVGQDDDWRGTPVTVFAPDDDGGHILQRTATFFDRALAAKADGLPAQDVVAMTALWIGAAHNHFLRSGSASRRYAEAHDSAAVAFADRLFGLDGADPNVTREVIGLPACMGGLGWQLAVRRRPAAWLAAAEANLEGVLDTLDLAGDSELRARVPAWDIAVKEAEDEFRGLGGQILVARWTSPHALNVPRRQKELSFMAAKGAQKLLLATLPMPARALLRDGGGPGGGAFLRPASDHGHVIADAAFVPAVRRRLLLRGPGTTGLQHCPCCTRGGRVCGAPLGGNHGSHSVQCHAGGGPIKRHSALLCALAKWLRRRDGASVSLEQWLPHLSIGSQDEDGPPRARLDIVFHDAA